jgi:chromosome segregation ATPase
MNNADTIIELSQTIAELQSQVRKLNESIKRRDAAYTRLQKELDENRVKIDRCSSLEYELSCLKNDREFLIEQNKELRNENNSLTCFHTDSDYSAWRT